jgi:probable HAF family extracellular repeat protein
MPPKEQAAGKDPVASNDASANDADAVPHYHAVVLDTLPNEVYCIATGINDARQICGYSQNQKRENTPVSWDGSGGVAAPLSKPAGAAMAINDKGIIVGSFSGHATLWNDAVSEDLGMPAGAISSQAFGINAAGDVVGGAINAAKLSLPWIKLNGVPVTLLPCVDGWPGGLAEHISTSGLIAGKLVKASGAAHACLWTDGKPADLGTLGGEHSDAQGVNEKGIVVGIAETKDGDAHACYWQDGKIHDLPLLPEGTASAAHAVNASGVIVGEGDLSNAAVWIHDSVHNLNDLVIEKGFTLGNATAINNKGDILAWGTIPGEEEVARAVLLTPAKP